MRASFDSLYPTYLPCLACNHMDCKTFEEGLHRPELSSLYDDKRVSYSAAPAVTVVADRVAAESGIYSAFVFHRLD